MLWRALGLIVGVFTSWLIASAARGLAQAQAEEYQVKSVYLYHFCQFVDWPKNAVQDDEKRMVLGVLGPDPFGAHLDKVAAQNIQGKKVVVRRFASAKEYQPCHLLFVAGEDHLADALAKTKGAPVLVVTDKPGLAEKGAMINLFLDEQKTVKFEIHPDAAKRAGLNIRAQLLKLARIVKDAKEAP